MSKTWQGGMRCVLFILLILASKIVCGQVVDTIRPVQHSPDNTYMDSADNYIIYNGEVYPGIGYLLTLFPTNIQVELLMFRREVLQAHKDMIDRENNRVKGILHDSIPPTDTLGHNYNNGKRVDKILVTDVGINLTNYQLDSTFKADTTQRDK